jgi:putative spermidine/putrescine transport system substrate-binding protein
MLRRLRLRRLPWLVLAVALCCGSAGAAEVLRVLSWPGYADADVVEAFEARTGAKVEVTVVDADETLWQRIVTRDGADYDVFAVNTAELQRYIDRGLLVPIEPAALSNLGAQLPRFRDPSTLPGTTRDGKLYAVPYAWAEMGLIYDRRQLDAAPQSIAALWDPRHRGKVLVYNGGAHNFSLAAQMLGKASPFRLDGADWTPAVERLIELRRNMLTFYVQPEESAHLFISRGAALMFANYGTQQLQLLRAAGADVGYVVPREGALAWLDCWVITRGARNKTLALAWIDHLLGTGAAHVLSTRHGLANTRDPAPHQTDSDRLLWLEPVEDVERRNLLWERILSGDRAARVLAP